MKNNTTNDFLVNLNKYYIMSSLSLVFASINTKTARTGVIMRYKHFDETVNAKYEFNIYGENKAHKNSLSPCAIILFIPYCTEYIV